MAVKGAAIAVTAVGGIFLWSGLFNQKVTLTIQQLVQGKKPQKGPEAASPGSAGTSGNVPALNKTFSASASANRALGKAMAAARGWGTGNEWNALDTLWGKDESGWDNTAQNPNSTAYGIAQFLDTTWAGYGPKTSNPALQIKYGLKYIADRYGDPIAALAHENSAGWY